MTTAAENTVKVYEASLSRRQFVKTGGALVVGVAFVGPSVLKSQGFQGPKVTGALFKNTLDPTLPTSWIEIHPDNTVLIRTGKSDFGQGTTFTAYRQIVADELSVLFEAITTVVAGHTDQTPDGSGPSISSAAARQTSEKPLRTPIKPSSTLPLNASESRKIDSLSKTASSPAAAKRFLTATSSKISNSNSPFPSAEI